jgi:host factor-I protein
MAEKFNLQDRFLNHLRLHKVEAKVFLVNGFQIRGEIRSFDSFTILLEDGKTQSLIYKHAVSTITPSSYVKLAKPQEEEPANDANKQESQ